MSISANFPNVFPSLELNFANSQQLDPRVTFSRSTTAPYYDGKTSVLAEQNLFLYSQLFSNSVWLTSNVTNTATSAVNAPDGTTTAFTSIPTTTNATHQLCEQGITQVLGLPYTFSIVVKANGYTLVSITQYTGSSAVNSFFDLSAGTVTSGTGSISSQGNGWYRISQTVTATTSGFNQYFGQLFAVNTGTNTSFAGDGTSGYYIWGGQAEQRSSVTAYNATTTTPITNYIPQLLTAPINAPRFDFNPTTGESLGLLIEQSSTNLLTYSQDFSNAVWQKSNSSITTSANIAPDGTQTAQLLVENASTSSHILFISSGLTTGTTLSLYAKAKGRTKIGIGDSSNQYLAKFDLSNGTVTTASNNGVTGGSITSVGNGWYRMSCQYTGSTVGLGIFLLDSSGNTSYTGDGYSGIYIWQAQLEALAFATSPIATTSAQVTRASDNASMTGTNFSSWYNQGQGTIYCESATNDLSASPLALIINDGTLNNVIQIGRTNLTNLAERVYLTANNTNYVAALGTGTTTQNQFAKTSFSFSTNNFIGSVNGNLTSQISTGIVPTVNRMDIGCYLSTNSYLNGRIKKIAIYPQQVTSTNQQALTGS